MSKSIFETYADEDFSPGPPDPPDGTEFDVEHVVSILKAAAAGIDLESQLSYALSSIEYHSYRSNRRALEVDERLAILNALERAYRTAWRRLAPEYPRAQIVAGMRGAAAMVDYWHTKRPIVAYDVLYDAKALARCFRNDLHNACLRQEMANRERGRGAAFEEPRPIFPAEPPAIVFLNAA